MKPRVRLVKAGVPIISTVEAAYEAITLAEQAHRAMRQDILSGALAACGSKWLLELSAKLYAWTERYRRPSLQDAKHWSRERNVSLEHRQLLNAAVARDANQAAGLLARHYRETGRAVRKVLALNAARPVASSGHEARHVRCLIKA